MKRRTFLKLIGSALVLAGTGISFVERAIKPHPLQPPNNTPAKRHWNDPYRKDEVSYLSRASNWCVIHGENLRAL